MAEIKIELKEQAKELYERLLGIVHCKDCKYSIEVKESDSIICRHPSQHATYERTNDDYCSYGERKEKSNE